MAEQEDDDDYDEEEGGDQMPLEPISHQPAFDARTYPADGAN